MPQYSDIFIATPDTAGSYSIIKPNSAHISLEDLTDHELCLLWATLERTEHDVCKHELEFVEVESDAILYKLPAVFTTLLAELTEPQIITAGALWVEFDEISWKPEQGQQKISQLNEMAQQALQEGKALYLILD